MVRATLRIRSVGAGAHVEPCHGGVEYVGALFRQLTPLLQQAAAHLSVAVHVGFVGVSLGLDAAGVDHAGPDCIARLAAACRRQFFERHRHYLHLNVDTVEQRAGNASEIPLYRSRLAGALLGRMVVVAARHGFIEATSMNPAGYSTL